MRWQMPALALMSSSWLVLVAKAAPKSPLKSLNGLFSHHCFWGCHLVSFNLFLTLSVENPGDLFLFTVAFWKMPFTVTCTRTFQGSMDLSCLSCHFMGNMPTHVTHSTWPWREHSCLPLPLLCLFYQYCQTQHWTVCSAIPHSSNQVIRYGLTYSSSL